MNGPDGHRHRQGYVFVRWGRDSRVELVLGKSKMES